MSFTKKDKHYFKLAKEISYYSDYHPFHIGCVIVYKNAVIGRGFNSCKTHTIQKKYNRKYREFVKSEKDIVDSLHAEISAILSVDRFFKDWGNVKIYIYRPCKSESKICGMARPCPACMGMLRDKGIKHIYYTGDNSYIYEKLNY